MAESADRVAAPAPARQNEPGRHADPVERHQALEDRAEVQAEREHGRLLNGRPALAAQRRSAEHLAGRPAPRPAPVQRAAPPNRTGLPDGLKAGVESLSGHAMDDVKVHYNSAKPATLDALAYAQGPEIHLAPGQESHLPHEAWHVVQQKQGRVRPTIQMKEGMKVNDDARLEREADLMGAKALQGGAPRGNVPAEGPGVPSASAPAQLFATPVVQLGKDKKKRLNNPKRKNKKVKKKDRGFAGMAPDRKLAAEQEWEPDDEGESYHVIAQEGADKSPYEEEYETPQLFWRGDTRGPDQVFATGFTTNNERAGKVKAGANRIIWRRGGQTDDILPASAVCMAKDIRGGAFFPLTGESEFYLYAVAKTRTVNTFKAQKHAEEAQTGHSGYGQETRYEYDPEYEEGDKASAVWQFQEHAAHRVETEEMVAAFEVERKTLVPPDAKEKPNVAIAGVQFRLVFDQLAAIDKIESKTLKAQMYALAKTAKATAAKYEKFYPEGDQFLSYMGIVEPKSTKDMPKTMAEAPAKVRQVQPVVIQEKAALQPGAAGPPGTGPTLGDGSAARNGLPEPLKAGIETLSGVSMDSVRVHRNSAKPASLNALAFAQGSDIHLGPGQEQHLPHEAWHLVQQAQGRVRPTVQMKGGVPINDDTGLEREADLMGAKAARARVDTGDVGNARLSSPPPPGAGGAAQRVLKILNNPLSPQVIRQNQEGVKNSDAVKAALAQRRLAVPNWDKMIDELVVLAEHDTEFKYDKISQAIIAIITLGGSRGVILTAAAQNQAPQQDEQSQEGDKSSSKPEEQSQKGQKSSSSTTEKSVESAYKSKVGEYESKFKGAIVLVESNYVVVMEHYQLKHNPDIKVLYTGGPYKGDKGSQMDGGWDAHVKTYAPEVLEYAKAQIPSMGKDSVPEKKARLTSIEAYISITMEGKDYIITYHGNPPKADLKAQSKTKKKSKAKK